jgi:hypothetical protein
MLKLTGTELLGPLLLLGVCIDRKDPLALLGARTLDNRQTNTPNTENGNVRLLIYNI